jgi:hypothetical protein
MGTDAVRHGAYLCVSAPREAYAAVAAAPVADLAARLGVRNEFLARDGHPSDAVAFVRRLASTAGQIGDDAVSHADALIHVASNDAAIVSTFCGEAERLLVHAARVRVLSGTVPPTRYTGNAMHDFAYAHQRVQQAGGAMPNAFLLPLRKLPEWWAKDWMERHTYFLPRYDADGRMAHEGHALAASAGIPALMRRTYRCAEEGGYDFLTYFECADADVPVFHAVCAALRDVERNPEWRFVREGPTWHGRRMESWSALWAP